ncbi:MULTISPECIES: asparagine synthase-related protein [Sphingomonas]|jgi:asparagine synthase (glutamine-hydrolysing)|uniref:asparagine synthase-related protein n=2 Tax=Pseudomonadota TaxID=1224 RepID=UPI002FF2C75B
MELLSAGGAVHGGVRWDALGRMLFWSGLPTRETALVGIDMILAGTTLILDGHRENTVTSWSPWDFAEAPTGEGSTAAGERLRRAIDQSIGAWSSLYRHPLLSVSGGLDSSIVVDCIARSIRERSGREVSCITLYTDDPAGDERDYARQVCAALNLPLVECRYALEAVDLGRALGAHLPRPAGRVEAQPYETAHRAIAAHVGAYAFFTGNGGDNVFCYSRSAAALADRALQEGLGAGAVATLRDICRQTGPGRSA